MFKPWKYGTVTNQQLNTDHNGLKLLTLFQNSLKLWVAFRKVDNNNKSHKIQTESKHTFIHFVWKGK